MKNISTGKKILLGIAILCLVSFILNIKSAENLSEFLITAVPTFIIIYAILSVIWIIISKKEKNKQQDKESTDNSQRKSKKTGVIIFIVIAIIGVMIVNFLDLKSIVNKENKSSNTKGMSLNEMFGMTDEEFAEIDTIFNKCGFTKITKVEKEDELDDGTTSYYIEMEGVKPNKVISVGKTEGNIIYVYLTKNNKLSEIEVNFNPVYKNGKILNKVVAFTELNVEEKTNCQMICESLIEKMLKSPTTAKFCDYLDYRWSKENGIIKAQGYVDSQNGFGAMIRTNYVLTYDCVKQKAISINVDGKKFNYE